MPVHDPHAQARPGQRNRKQLAATTVGKLAAANKPSGLIDWSSK